MRDFSRIKRLPPYVFNITGELTAEAGRTVPLADAQRAGGGVTHVASLPQPVELT